jgi:hypothetical protein
MGVILSAVNQTGSKKIILIIYLNFNEKTDG